MNRTKKVREWSKGTLVKVVFSECSLRCRVPDEDPLPRILPSGSFPRSPPLLFQIALKTSRLPFRYPSGRSLFPGTRDIEYDLSSPPIPTLIRRVWSRELYLPPVGKPEVWPRTRERRTDPWVTTFTTKSRVRGHPRRHVCVREWKVRTNRIKTSTILNVHESYDGPYTFHETYTTFLLTDWLQWGTEISVTRHEGVREGPVWVREFERRLRGSVSYRLFGSPRLLDPFLPVRGTKRTTFYSRPSTSRSGPGNFYLSGKSWNGRVTLVDPFEIC